MKFYRWPMLVLAACITTGAHAAEPAINAEAAQETAANLAPGEYPRKRTIEGASLVVYAPQIRSWQDFKEFDSLIAIEVMPDGSTDRFLGTAELSGDTEVDMDKRIVVVTQPQIDKVTFSNPAAADIWADRVKAAVLRSRIDVPVDLFLSYLADDVLETPTPAGFNTEPPPIYVRDSPAIIVLIQGDPITADISGASLQLIPNASFPIVKDPIGSKYYLLNGKHWLTAPALDGPWVATVDLPMSFSQISANAGFDTIRKALPPTASDEPAPQVIVAHTPSELIVTKGIPELEQITGTDGLSYVKNTTSPLFKLAADWYFLASGRWFTSTSLDNGPWRFVQKLPAAFASIPADSPVAYVLASVADTPEARLALLEAMLPKMTTTASGAKPDAQVTYAGDATFEKIEGTDISRATNTDFDVLSYQDMNYLCYQGAWYSGTSPTGPWQATANVPTAFYQIPPDSPAYPCTYVKVENTTNTTIVYSSTPAYWNNVYLAYGIPVYGTGWYYPPYIYGPYYYPYSGTYGYGSWYNPATGTYGSRSVWYGPYGGYTYANAYNPATGGYRYSEASWDGDGWKSDSQTYNPRTGVSTDTSRNYNADKQRYTQDRTFQKGDQSANVQRTRDYDGNWSSVDAEGSRGGSFNSKREYDNGTMTGSGSLETADGREADFNSEVSDGQGTINVSGSDGGSASISREVGPGGVTGEGEFSKDGQTVSTSTQRSGGTSRTEMESSAGGSAVSVSNGTGRTSVGQSAGGDLYAGHNGNVYRRTDDGWEQHTGDGWQQTDGAGAQRQGETGGQRDLGSIGGGMSGQAGMNASGLNRDFSARQRGFQGYNQRSSFGNAGGMRGGAGGGFRQMGGSGGMRGGMGGRGGGRGGGRR